MLFINSCNHLSAIFIVDQINVRVYIRTKVVFKKTLYHNNGMSDVNVIIVYACTKDSCNPRSCTAIFIINFTKRS